MKLQNKFKYINVRKKKLKENSVVPSKTKICKKPV